MILKKRHIRALKKIATAILKSPHERQWGVDLWERSGVRTGVLYPILTKMLYDGWLEDGWEELYEKQTLLPRRYYKVTELGLIQLRNLVKE